MKKIKIGVIEDEFMIFEIIKESLAIFDFEIIYINPFIPIFKQLKYYKIKFLILDYHLPRMSGHDIAQKIRTHKKFMNIPIILLTSKKLNQDELIETKKLNLKYMEKPFTPHVLKLKITEMLAENEYLEE